MITTHEEARKLCCHNKLLCDVPGGELCIGKDCMAWRWFGELSQWPEGDRDSIYVRQPDSKSDLTRFVGYCGLAGKP
jgi:hypothetical protein